MDFIKIMLAVIVIGMATSTGFAVGIAAGATVITRVTFPTHTERKILYTFGGVCAIVGALCGIYFWMKIFLR